MSFVSKCVTLVAIAGVLAVAACSSTTTIVTSGTGQGGTGQGSVSANCFVRVTDSNGNSVTVGFLGDKDCTQPAGTIADNMGSQGFTVTPNVPKGPGNPICTGAWDGDTATVISPDGLPNAVCTELALGPVG